MVLEGSDGPFPVLDVHESDARSDEYLFVPCIFYQKKIIFCRIGVMMLFQMILLIDGQLKARVSIQGIAASRYGCALYSNELGGELGKELEARAMVQWARTASDLNVE